MALLNRKRQKNLFLLGFCSKSVYILDFLTHLLFRDMQDTLSGKELRLTVHTGVSHLVLSAAA